MYRDLKHFKESEFREHSEIMDSGILTVLDKFREYWGAPVIISPHPDALARYLGKDNTSKHNVDKWDKCLAADIFPRGMDTQDDMKRAYDCAIMAGAHGIGLYVDTKPSFMLHLDVRRDKTPSNPAKWGRKEGKYVSIDEILKEGE